MITGCLVRNTRCMAASTAWPTSANSGPRWSMVGMSIARSTRSGTLVGPGICRKCLPVCTVMGVLPGLALASCLGVSSRSNITIWRACRPPDAARQCIRSRAGAARRRAGASCRLAADDLEMRRGIALRTLLQILHRGIDASGAVRYACDRQAHLHAGQRTEQRELVAFAEMADAKHLARDFRQA